MNRVIGVDRNTGSGAADLIDYTYTGGLLTKRRLTTRHGCPAFVDMDLTYDQFGRNDAITNRVKTASWSGVRLSDYAYTYDKVANRDEVTLTNTGGLDYTYEAAFDESVDYSYDTLNRVTGADWGTPTESFDYDMLGNRNSATDKAGATTYYANNAVNEYTKIGNPLPGSDNIIRSDRGNLLAYQGDFLETTIYTDYGFVYDEENRLVNIFDDDGAGGGTSANGVQDGSEASLVTFAYDALGRRIEIDGYQGDGTSGKRRFYFDGQNVIAEFDDAGTPVMKRYWVHGSAYIDERAFLHNPSTPAAKNLYYFLKDLYTVAGLVNDQGHEVERYTYDTYGSVQIQSVPSADLDYSGVVNASDRGVVSANLGDPCANGTVFDVDGSGSINGSDRGFVSSQIGLTVSEREDSAFGNRFLFTGRWLDIIYDGTARYDHKLQYNRARHYDAKDGRWLQRDPLGYVDGMGLYQYVQSAPSTLVDWAGLSGFPPPVNGPMGAGHYSAKLRKKQLQVRALLKRRALSALNSIVRIHSGYDYYGLTSLDQLISDMFAVSNRIGYNPSLDGTPRYHPWWNVMYLPDNPRDSSVFHEFIHAVQDFDGMSDIYQEEGEAWAAGEMLNALKLNLRAIEDELNSPEIRCERVRARWDIFWSTSIRTVIGFPWISAGSSGTVRAIDVATLNYQRHFHVSCAVTPQPSATRDVKIGRLAPSAWRWYIMVHAATEGN